MTAKRHSGMDPRSLRLDPLGDRYRVLSHRTDPERPRMYAAPDGQFDPASREPCLRCGARGDAGCVHRVTP